MEPCNRVHNRVQQKLQRRREALHALAGGIDANTAKLDEIPRMADADDGVIAIHVEIIRYLAVADSKNNVKKSAPTRRNRDCL